MQPTSAPAQPTTPSTSPATSPDAIIINGRDGEPDVRINVRDGQLRVSQGTTEKVIPLRDFIPKEAVALTAIVMGSLAFMVVGWPIARALARLIDRRLQAAPGAALPDRQLTERLETLERNIDTVAIEVEKLSEAQRFTTRLLQERAGAAAPSPGGDSGAPSYTP